jgi:hypothetical protein
MPSIIKALTLAANRERLIDEIKAQYPNMVYRFAEYTPEEPYIEVTDDNADDTTLTNIITAHDPQVLTTEQEQQLVQANAKSQAAAIPSWASWTEAEALAWHDTNITNALPVANLAAANTVLTKLEQENRALIRMVIALRNQVWSDLQG